MSFIAMSEEGQILTERQLHCDLPIKRAGETVNV
jgi:hypothetical protein